MVCNCTTVMYGITATFSCAAVLLYTDVLKSNLSQPKLSSLEEVV